MEKLLSEFKIALEFCGDGKNNKSISAILKVCDEFTKKANEFKVDFNPTNGTWVFDFVKANPPLGKEFYQSRTEMADNHLFDIATEKLKGQEFVSVEFYSTKYKKSIKAKKICGYEFIFDFDTYFYAEKLYKEILNRIK